MDVKQLLKTTIGKIRMLFAEEEIFYIGGSDVLPPPLEKEQEQKCLVALSDLTTKKKDYSKEDARKMLIEHNLRLVVYLAKKFEKTGIPMEVSATSTQPKLYKSKIGRASCRERV